MGAHRLLVVLIFTGTLSFSQVVTNATALNNAISAATPGTTITLADGVWNNTFIEIQKNGTATNPITITAQNPGAVFMTGNSRVYMRGSHIIISGLIFKDPANLVVSGSSIEPVFELNKCDNCSVINNKIDAYNGTEAQKTLKFKWVYIVDGQYNEIAYNSFIGKYGIGSIINDNRSLANADYLKIHHNYFADRTPINGINDDNDQDAIRIGTSTTSLSDSYSEVYANYFYNYFGEIEVISNKSGKNKYYNNTFRDYGGCLTLRHGDNCEVYGNYFLLKTMFLPVGFV
jgi:poly(beta-D-mannuronate) lyase